MKSLRVFLSVILTSAFITLQVSMIGCAGGCKSAAGNTYKTSGVTHVAATAALRGWNDYIGKAYAEAAANTDTNKAASERAKIVKQEEQVAAAWEKYQAAQVALLTATQEFSRIDPNAPHDPTAWDKVTQATLAASASAADIVALIRTFGVKL